MRYLPYAAASSEPNVIVDGTANDRTLITLSHWRRSGTPSDLMADTSTAIVFNYLDRPDLHVAADVVSNNHFDEDGLVGIYALLEPEVAACRRDLLIDVAQAGDFGVFKSRRAARIAFAISAHADPATSPFPRPLFDRPAPQVEEGLYRALLAALPRLLADIDESVRPADCRRRPAAWCPGSVIEIQRLLKSAPSPPNRTPSPVRRRGCRHPCHQTTCRGRPGARKMRIRSNWSRGSTSAPVRRPTRDVVSDADPLRPRSR